MSRNRHSYIAFYPSDWLAGTAAMSSIERVVYHEICLQCWDHAAAVAVDSLANRLGDIPSWRTIIDKLIEDEKIVREKSGKISNPRAIFEAKKALRTWQQKSKGGKTKAQKLKAEKRLQAPLSTMDSTVESAVQSELSPLRTRPENQNQNQNQNLKSLSSSPSSLGSALEKLKSTLEMNGMGNGLGGKETGETRKGLRSGNGVTIEDPAERIARFQQHLVPALGQHAWDVIAAATDDSNPLHGEALARCKHAATVIGKGWPQNWPTHERY